MVNITKNTVPKEIEAKIKTAIELKKELDKYEKEIKEALQDAMQEYDIKKIDNDSYYVTLVDRITYKADDTSLVDPTLVKVVLDTKKAGEYEKLYGVLPNGVNKAKSSYIKMGIK